MLVLMEDASEAVAPADVEAGVDVCRRIGEGSARSGRAFAIPW